MLHSYCKAATLFISVAFLFSPSAFSQVPVVDVGEPVSRPGSSNSLAAPDNAAQGELFYQLQLMQQEMMQLRGLVEEQAYTLNQLKQQSMERYIDLDKRISGLSGSAPAPAGADASTPVAVAIPVPEKAIPGEKEAYNNAYSLVTSKRFDSAVVAFQKFLVDYPDGQYTPNSLYWLGELYQVVKPQDLEAARQSFTQLIERYPDNSKAPDAMYKLGKVYFQKGDPVKAKEWMNRVISQYGNGVSSAADKARQFLQDNF